MILTQLRFDKLNVKHAMNKCERTNGYKNCDCVNQMYLSKISTGACFNE